ncbi:MAG: leucyl aminopeptidase [Patescibacteria group bacterium]|nr:leucyl aminopeptidase [Patescibacteria group bacterium]
MEFELLDKKIDEIFADCEVVFAVDKNLKHKWIKDLEYLKMLNFKADAEEAVFIPDRKKLYIAIDSMEHDSIRIACAQAIKILKKTNFQSVKIGLYVGEEFKADNIRAISEGFILGEYIFDKFRSKKIKNPIKKIIISSEEYSGKSVAAKIAKEELKTGRILANAVNFTREIANQPPDEMTPIQMSETAKKLAEENNLQCEIYDEKFLLKNKMNVFLAVGRGSINPSRLIHLIYKPKNAKKRIAIVGKGVTYDSGGLSLKPANSMITMKSDKSGAAAILGTMLAVKKLELPIEIHGIIGAVENMIGGNAYKPDDILTAKNGKTIEVKNTDAEGRLVLADCLCYAQEFKPDYILDFATLTGACVVALGEYTVGVMGFNAKLKKDIMQAADDSGELSAELPFNKYLPKLLKSEIADINNLSSSNYGGAITAGLFLSEFIKKENREKWAHLDIAGPAYAEKEWGCNPYGASGAGVKMATRWTMNLLK